MIFQNGFSSFFGDFKPSVDQQQQWVWSQRFKLWTSLIEIVFA